MRLRTFGFWISCLSALVFWRSIPESFDLVKSSWSIILAPFALMTASYSTRQTNAKAPDRYVKALFMLSVAFLVFSLFSSSNFSVSLIGMEHRFTGVVFWLSALMIAASCFVLSRSSDSGVFLRTLVITSVPFVFYGLLQINDLDPFAWNITSFGGRNVFSTQGNPNYAAWTAAIFLFAQFWALHVAATRVHRIAISSLLGASMWILASTSSIQGLAAVIFGSLVLLVLNTFLVEQASYDPRLPFRAALTIAVSTSLLFSGNTAFRAGVITLLIFALALDTAVTQISRKSVQKLVLTSVVAILVLGFLFRATLLQYLEDQSGERAAFYRAGWEMFIDRPFIGHGFDMYSRFFAEYRPTWHAKELPDSLTNSAHSIWLGLLVSGGLALFIPLVGLVIVTFRRAILALRPMKASRDFNHFVSLVVVAVTGTLISVEHASVILLASSLVGALLGMSTKIGTRKYAVPFRVTGYALSAAFLVFGSAFSYRLLEGNRSENLALQAIVVDGDLQKGLRLLERARDWGPVPAETGRRLSAIYTDLGFGDLAVEEVRKSAVSLNYTGDVGVQLAQTLLTFGRATEAKEVAEISIAKNPGNTDVLRAFDSLGLVSSMEVSP